MIVAGGVTRFFRTTALKLSALYFAVFAALSVFLIVYIGYNTSELLTKQMRETIDAEIQGLAEQYKSGGIVRLIRVVDVRSRAPGASLYLLTDFAGNRLAGNVADVPSSVLESPDGAPQPVPYVRLQDEDSGQPRVGGQASALVRVFVLPGGFRLLVGRDLAERDRFDHIVKRAYWFSIGVFLLLGFLTWLFVSRRVLKRIDAVVETSRRIMDGDLSGRLHVDGSGDEFDRLAESLNAMLERIEQLMRGLKEVSDNIAHDLKTPLTRLRNRLEETLRQDPDAADYREVIGASIEDSDTLIRTFEALLRIARVEAGSAGLEAVPTDLSEIVGEVGELYEPAGEEIDVAVKVSVAPGLWVIGHRELIAQAIANLVDNAFKYGKPTDESVAPVVRITLTASNGHAVVEVADNGPGVPPQDRERVVQRFVRLEASRSAPGSGLGLSLVQAVASLHKGELVLGDAAPGLAIRLVLPIVPPPEPVEAANADVE